MGEAIQSVLSLDYMVHTLNRQSLQEGRHASAPVSHLKSLH